MQRAIRRRVRFQTRHRLDADTFENDDLAMIFGVTRRGLILVGALAWGFAEATLFFIVPDVLLTLVATTDGRLALGACLFAVCGALLGGALMYAWGAEDPVGAKAVLEHVPAVHAAMIQEVEDQIHERGADAIFFGPLEGKPYKLYAVEAGACGVPIVQFLILTGPARLLRFLLLTVLVWSIARWPCRRWSVKLRRGALIACWLLFYAGYFCYFGI